MVHHPSLRSSCGAPSGKCLCCGRRESKTKKVVELIKTECYSSLFRRVLSRAALHFIHGREFWSAAGKLRGEYPDSLTLAKPLN